MATARSREESDQRPDLCLERQAWQAGARWVAGIDEVGRGALAGPVVVGAVVLPRERTDLVEGRLAEVRDSKLLSPADRAELSAAIVKAASAASVAAVGPLAVDALGIAAAVRLAARRAVAALGIRPQLLLVDGSTLRGLDVPQRAIVRGDRQVLSIACASVVAKAYRDAMMIALSMSQPEYDLDGNKGYLTAGHQSALSAAGPCWLHRLTWAPLRESWAGRSYSRWPEPAPCVSCDGAITLRTPGR